MADEEQAQPQSIQERIAALKLGQVGRTPGQQPPSYDQSTRTTNGTGRPRPPPPPRPTLPVRPDVNQRTNSANNPPLRDYASSSDRLGNMPEEPRPNGASANGMDGISRPCLPPRTSTASTQSSLGPTLPPRKGSQVSPALPPRRPSDMALSRRESNESISSIGTMRSSVSGMSNGTSVTSRSDRFAIRAPEFDASALPALPPKRTQEEKDAQFAKDAMRRPSRSANPMSNMMRKGSAPNVPARPNSRPQSRPATTTPSRTESRQDEPSPAPQPVPTPRPTEPPPARKSALTMGFGNATAQAPKLPTNRPGADHQDHDAPPPISASSKPDLAALQASKPRTNGAAPTQAMAAPGSCLHCRDFSAPDNHAARFPRQSIPSSDAGWLAHQLTAPFPSATDKARAIFTWLHHNVAYDTVAFFNNAVKPSTPQGTIASGLAVCEGYAGLFAALALKAGLECMVLSGASKGYGHSQIKPGDPIPPFKSTHAWNVCRIDNGEYKLIDPCWGAGNLGGNKTYNKDFSPERFTQSNDDFGRDHFPTDHSKQYRNDGTVLSYEDYILGSKSGTSAQIYDGYVAEEGLSLVSFKPAVSPIVLSQQGPTVRFSFQKVCPHWDPVCCGKGPYYLYVLKLDGLDGTDRNHIPFEQGDGVWWCDVSVRDLGRPGQKAHIYTVTSFDGRDGRGLTIQEYRQKKGRVGMGFGGVGAWDTA